MHDNIVKAPVTSVETAIFICPSCNGRKITNVSRLLKMDKPIRLKVTCTCGNKYVSMIEKRRKYRKPTNFPGTYALISNGDVIYEGLMTVCDISLTGMKLKLNIDKLIELGDIIKVQFHLDDAQRSLIEKKVKVVSLNLPYLGAEFLRSEDIGNALGFYLFK